MCRELQFGLAIDNTRIVAGNIYKKYSAKASHVIKFSKDSLGIVDNTRRERCTVCQKKKIQEHAVKIKYTALCIEGYRSECGKKVYVPKV